MSKVIELCWKYESDKKSILFVCLLKFAKRRNMYPTRLRYGVVPSLISPIAFLVMITMQAVEGNIDARIPQKEWESTC